MFKYEDLTSLFELNSLSNKGITLIYGKDSELYISYENLYTKAIQILYNLQLRGIKKGEELIFQVEDIRQFIFLFWACILGGIVPVPISVGNNDEHRLKVINIWRILKSPHLVTSEDNLLALESYAIKNNYNKEIEIIKNNIIFDNEIDALTGTAQIIKPSPDDIAFIQFSSGSTGQPKGVVLTHRNLLANINAIIKCSKSDSKDSTFSWMPLTHDMGLIGFHLCPIAAAMNQYIMPTTTFIRNPSLWMQKVNEHKTTILASPNFGYKYFLESFNHEITNNWDLSHVRLIFNGAEPISANLINKFLDVMSIYRLKKNTIFPVYGMAEASLAVTFPHVEEELTSIVLDRRHINIGQSIKEIYDQDINSVTFVDLGYPVLGCQVRVCCENNIVLDESKVGHIQIKGENVTSGYYNNEEATNKVMTTDGWLNTGDIGFIRNDRLVVTGRAKDIIFVNGQNFYPHDIEQFSEDIDGIELGNVAACGVFNKESQKDDIILFVLYKKELENFVSLSIKLKKYLNQQIGLDIKHVIPVKKIPKTTSGKVQRYKLGEYYQEGNFTELINEIKMLEYERSKNTYFDPPENEIEEELVKIWCEVLNIENIGVSSNFFELGGNSLKAASLISRIHKIFNVEIPLSSLVNLTNIRQFAQYIQHAENSTFNSIEYFSSICDYSLDYYPVSAAQKRIFVLEQIEENNTFYNIPVAIMVEGLLDKERLELAFRELVKRHDVLRTSFELVQGDPVQIVHDNVNFEIDFKESEESEIDNIIKQFSSNFDLSRAPLLRAGLIKISHAKHLLLFDIHHIISDGTSMGILFDELFKLYTGEVLPSSKIKYKDYSLWQVEMQKSHKVIKQEEYWEGIFSGDIPVLNMPTDYPRPAIQSFEGERLKISIDEKLKSKLCRLAAETKTTLYMILLAAYNVMLSKYSGQEDIVVGSPIAGRLHNDLEKVVGMFVNTLAIRNYPSGCKTFIEFLEDVKQNALMAYSNQDYQFEALVERLKIQRDMSRNPLFDTMFVLQNIIREETQVGDLKFVPYDFDYPISKFDLTLFAEERRDGIHFEFEYCTKLFNEKTILSLMKHFINILEYVVTDPQTNISDIEMLSYEEKQKLIFEYNKTKTLYPQEKLIYQLFEEQAEKTPDGIAVEFEGELVTYEELNRKSNSLARVLREKGIDRESRVAILQDRTIEIVISILAILKAGGAYLPIDNTYPSDRIQYMLEDSGATLLLSDGRNSEKIPSIETIDVTDQVLYMLDEKNLPCINTPQDIAYVIYTSGSTGKPKGAMIEHRGVVNYIWWASKSYIRNEKFDFPLYTSISFDLTVTSIFTPLITGNKIVVYKEDSNELLIQKILKENKVGIIKLTPAHLKLIKDMENGKSSVKRFIVGGEQLEAALALDIYNSFNGYIEIYNEYGPTETVVGCMIHKFDPVRDIRPAVPVGIPADNARIYILDRYQNPVPVNVEGEMYIAGDGVARGYLNRDELTQERFLPDPFVPGERMYRTGDLARRMHDGIIEYIGRIDHQVKIRGYRIELGEIENELKKHDSIVQTVVLDKDDNDGNKYLCAYIVCSRGITVGELREYLSKKLPDYMVPSYFVELEAIPLTINGKIDRKNLPEPNRDINTGMEYSIPKDEIENLIAEVWQDVLGVTRVGTNDNFFTLGGDSIKAIQVVSRLNHKGITISPKDILTYQSISQIKLNVDIKKDKKKYMQEIIEGETGLTPIIKWFTSQKFNNPNYYNQSVILKLKKDVNILYLEKAFTKIIQHHDGLRLNYELPQNKLYFNNTNQKGNFNLERFDISYLPPEKRAIGIEEICIKLKSCFDIGKDLLIKAAIIKCTEYEEYLFITAHHIIMDGISWRILLGDLFNVYQALEEDREVLMPEKTASFKDWYDELINYSNSSLKEREYWLDIENTIFNLPKDFESQENKLEFVNNVKYVLDEIQTKNLLVDVHKTYNTEVMDIFLTALAMTVKQWSNSSVMTFEIENHGRHLEYIDTSRTIGWFTAMYPVKLELCEDDIEKNIKVIKEQLRSIPGNGIGYGVLKYITGEIPPQLGTIPQIRFNYLGQFDNELDNELFEYLNYNAGSDVCLTNSITTLIDINCMVINKKFKIDIAYSKKIFKDETMSRFGDNYLNNLTTLLDYILKKDDIYFTPSDFEIAGVNQEDLDALFI